ncbi:MAG: hypothetical protein ABSA17_03260 [Rhabdochlamydiaceae bacterium]
MLDLFSLDPMFGLANFSKFNLGLHIGSSEKISAHKSLLFSKVWYTK